MRPAAFDIPLGYWFAGRRLRHGYTIVKRALLDRTRCRFPEPDDLDAPGMGEQEGHYQPLAESVARLRAPIEHEDLDPVRTWFERHNRYSDWEAWLELNPAGEGADPAGQDPAGAALPPGPVQAAGVLRLRLRLQARVPGRAGRAWTTPWR